MNMDGSIPNAGVADRLKAYAHQHLPFVLLPGSGSSVTRPSCSGYPPWSHTPHFPCHDELYPLNFSLNIAFVVHFVTAMIKESAMPSIYFRTPIKNASEATK